MSFNHSLGSFFFLWENFPASVSKSMNNDSICSYLHYPQLPLNASKVFGRQSVGGCSVRICFVFRVATQFFPAYTQLTRLAFSGP